MNKKLDDLKLSYRRTFKTDDGSIVLADLKKRFSFETTTFVSGDPHQSAFQEGQRQDASRSRVDTTSLAEFSISAATQAGSTLASSATRGRCDDALSKSRRMIWKCSVWALTTCCRSPWAGATSTLPPSYCWFTWAVSEGRPGWPARDDQQTLRHSGRHSTRAGRPSATRQAAQPQGVRDPFS